MGAFMNEAYQAQHGLEPGLFPEAVPTYLGHYHLPHAVGKSNVRYVGSPYQGTQPLCSDDLVCAVTSMSALAMSVAGHLSACSSPCAVRSSKLLWVLNATLLDFHMGAC